MRKLFKGLLLVSFLSSGCSEEKLSSNDDIISGIELGQPCLVEFKPQIEGSIQLFNRLQIDSLGWIQPGNTFKFRSLLPELKDVDYGFVVNDTKQRMCGIGLVTFSGEVGTCEFRNGSFYVNAKSKEQYDSAKNSGSFGILETPWEVMIVDDKDVLTLGVAASYLYSDIGELKSSCTYLGPPIPIGPVSDKVAKASGSNCGKAERRAEAGAFNDCGGRSHTSLGPARGAYNLDGRCTAVVSYECKTN